MTEPSNAFTPTLECQGLVKIYGRVTALAGTDFALYPGEVLAVIGDNGSGKSTLIRCLSGAERPDAGVMRLEGATVQFRDPTAAREAGVNTSYQSLIVPPDPEIAPNLLRGTELRKGGPLARVVRMLEERGMRQPKALPGTKVIILDEPTTAMGARASAQVSRLIETLRGRGMPVVFISHNLHQVLAIADRIHVQRLGQRVAAIDPRRFGIPEIVAIMRGTLLVDEADQAMGPIR